MSMTRFILFFCALTVLCGPLCANGHAPEPLPARYDGSMMPYDFDGCSPDWEIPDSLTPVHISYISRHGARYLSSPAKVEKIEKALAGARIEGSITPLGEAFDSLISRVRKISDGKWGQLSPTGINEQIILGEYLDRQFPELLGRARINAIATFVPRVIMTMDRLTHQLACGSDQVQIYSASGHQFGHLLYCFDTDSAYADYRDNGDWKKIYDNFVRNHVSPEPARRLVGNSLSEHKLRELTMSIYGMLQGLRASGLEAPDTRWMSVDEYRQCWLASNVSHWLRNTDTPYSKLAGRASSPLLETIIADADRALQNPDGTDRTDMHGYFGHAETLMPLLSLMNIKGYNAPDATPDNLVDRWQIQEVTPLSANVVVALFRAPSGRIYAMMRINGRDVAPVNDNRLLVEWNQLKAFWLMNIANCLNLRNN